ncbi:MAG: TPM domain-containing protein [Thermaurantiacus sp.]
MVRGLAAFLLLFWAALATAQQFPALTGRVVDAAGVLSPQQEASLTQKSADLEAATGRQFVVATIPDLQGYDIADYGYRLGRHWGIGEKGKDSGILLIVAPAERRVRIEVGYGLEPVMTDALSRRIIETQFRPRARDGDIPGGIAAAADAVIAQLQLPPEEAEARAREATEQDGPPAIAIIIFFIFIALFLLLVAQSARRAARTGGMAGTSGPIVIWGPPAGTWGGGRSRGSSWGGGGFGGGGFGGGGFSGGGGGFGGGGASGGW